MKKHLITLNTLNILDIITTYIALSLGLFEENYWMALLIEYNQVLEILFKLTLVFSCSLILYKFKAKVGFIICNIVFSLVVLSNIILILTAL